MRHDEDAPPVCTRFGVVVVRVTGALGASTVRVVDDALAGSDASVVVDCARISDADRDALAELARLHRGDRRPVLRRVTPRLRVVLDEAGLTDLVAYAEREPPRRRRVRDARAAGGRPAS